MKALRPTIVFDLDGTLADTAHDLIATLNLILGEEGLPPLTMAEARAMIGGGAKILIARGFEAEGRELTPVKHDELFKRFIGHYGSHLCVETKLFPGVEKALENLSEAGYGLAVCTNKIEAHSVELLQLLGIADRFEAICGRDTFPCFKPDPRHLLLTIDKANGDRNRTVMIGDSQTDIVTAQSAGIPVVAVSFGYTTVPVEAFDPDIVIDRYDELADAVERILVGATGIEPVTLRV